MKPHPRIRKTVKWGGAVVSVLLLLAWVGTAGNATFRHHRGPFEICAHAGWATFVYRTDRPGVHTQMTALQLPTPFGMSDRFFLLHDRLDRGFAVPLWLPASIWLLVTALAWRLDTLARRRARLNLCPKCTYDRTGLAPQTVCPECGTPAAPL